MAEQLFLRSPQSAAAQAPLADPNRTGIPINWREDAVITITIRPRRTGMATELWCINFKQSCLQALNAPFVLNDEGKRILAGMPGRRAT